MVLKIIRKLELLFYKSYNKVLFRKVNCELSKLVIVPEYFKNFVLIHPENLTIGLNTVINGDLTINALGGVKIGRYCHIAKGCTIYSHNHNFKSNKLIPYDGEEILRPVEVGDAVWIGANVTIAPGAKIGHGVIVAAGSVVFGEIPDCAIVRGNPAKVVGWRDTEVFWKLYKEGKFA